ncbi:MAG TPA: methylenetetrahydrofolate--tRNA-(uracil(54)-C(5))-methyltransferase (FADH(2)-oxidizing) TrmFO [Thermodesulfobacteriota bacterium]|nr:methylenetetrahydrofolate--tRNA-(uracil(54)-C(5))-methyltransferase (FADH(2)-oxidizing) TrmFO [Thermodesulfobacteriota bacterium]
MPKERVVSVIGGGLAGSEAAFQVARFGLRARVFEMRPKNSTPAHKTGDLAELVCSNSLKSDALDNASGILKEEMRILGSIVIEAADQTRLPAGKALAVDRKNFSSYMTKKIEEHPLIEVVREEVKEIPESKDGPVIIATGPLTSESLSEEIRKKTGSSHLYFYDAISPILDADSIDYSVAFRASRYGRGQEEEGDYLNCPLTKDEYYRFIEELLNAEKVETHYFEQAHYFEACLPIEVMAERGKDTLRFGPMRPMGITDPRTGKTPFAVVQLRMENKNGTMYNMVGFQTKLKYPEQRRILRMIPGLEKAEFMRYGSIHRNTYINSPKLLHPTLQLKGKELIFFAGQIVGVEGYVESAAMGVLAGINAARVSMEANPIIPPPQTAIGALIRYITDENIREFQPMNINFGLFPSINDVPKSKKKQFIAERALALIADFKALLPE